MEVDRISYIFGSFSRRRQSQEIASKRRSVENQKISHDRWVGERRGVFLGGSAFQVEFGAAHDEEVGAAGAADEERVQRALRREQVQVPDVSAAFRRASGSAVFAHVLHTLPPGT